MPSTLLSPFQLRELTLTNRIVYSPMGQEAAEVGGAASDWHLIHLGTMALSGAALIFTEATAISAQGMGSPCGMALWRDDQEAALKRIIDACRRYSPAKHAIQIWHAGRKGSYKTPQDGGGELPVDGGGWGLVGPSALPYPGRTNPMRALKEDELEVVKQDFVATAQRAARIGYDLLEVHCAHGYLLHSFLSPLSNKRTDRYGGDIEGRMRFPLEVIRAVREAWPQERPLSVRVSASDWHDDGWSIEDTVVFARAAKALGCDCISASSGGSTPDQKIKVAPGYQLSYAERIQKEAEIPTMAVGLIWEPHFAEFVVADNRAALVAIGRGLVADPRWPWRAAEALQGEVFYPIQHEKSVPSFMRKNLYRKTSGERFIETKAKGFAGP